MGDVAENARALEQVVGAAMPLHGGGHAPSRKAHEMGPACSRIEPQAGFNEWDRLSWSGFALRNSHESSNAPLAAVDVSFAGKTDTDFVRLRPGEELRVPRGFAHVWIRRVQPSWQDLTDYRCVVEITHAPLIEARLAQVVMTTPENPFLVTLAGEPVTIKTERAVAPAAGATLLELAPQALGNFEVKAELESTEPGLVEVAVRLIHMDDTNFADVIQHVFRIFASALRVSCVHLPLVRMVQGMSWWVRYVMVGAASAGALYAPRLLVRKVG
jgi:hypothetical protein